jgi:hypothetical protein
MVLTVYPRPSSCSSTTFSKTTTTVVDEPMASPHEGDPMQNTVECYLSGQKTEHVCMDSWCNLLGSAGIMLCETFLSNTFHLPSGFGSGVKIVTSLSLDQGNPWNGTLTSVNSIWRYRLSLETAAGKTGSRKACWTLIVALAH